MRHELCSVSLHKDTLGLFLECNLPKSKRIYLINKWCFLKGTLYFIEERTRARKGKKTSKDGMIKMMVSFPADLHYSAAPWCNDLNSRTVDYVIWNLKRIETSLLTSANSQRGSQMLECQEILWNLDWCLKGTPPFLSGQSWLHRIIDLSGWKVP